MRRTLLLLYASLRAFPYANSLPYALEHRHELLSSVFQLALSPDYDHENVIGPNTNGRMWDDSSVSRRKLTADDLEFMEIELSKHPLVAQLTNYDVLEHRVGESGHDQSVIQKDILVLPDVNSDLHRRQLTAAGHFNYTLNTLGHSYTLKLAQHISSSTYNVPHFKFKLPEKDTFDYSSIDEKSLKEMFSVEHHDMDCIYRGQVVHSTDGLHSHDTDALVSFCGEEIRASIKSKSKNNEIHPYMNLHIQPIASHGRQLSVAYRMEDTVNTTWTCGNEPSPDDVLYTVNASTEFVNRASSLDSIVEIFLVNDFARSQIYTVGAFRQAFFLFTLMEALYEDFPGTNTITVRLVGILTHEYGDPWTVTEVDDFFVLVETDVGREGLLSLFSAWMNKVYLSSAGTFLPPASGTNTISIDSGALLSGRRFISASNSPNVVGLGTVKAVCKTGSDSFSVTEDQFIDDRTATILSHEVGHNLGFQHTNVATSKGLTCNSANIAFVMDASGTSATSWSSCSQQWWSDNLDTGLGCVVDDAIAPANKEYCGNGQVDDGEECDCGMEDCSRVVNGTTPWDPCCNGLTCQYKNGALCARNDLCCDLDTCSPQSSGTVCRPKKDSSACDTAEVCDGTSATCPDDSFATFGISCTLDSSSEGRCFRGKCVSGQEQCKQRLGGNKLCQLIGSRDEVCTGVGVTGLGCADTCGGSNNVLFPEDGTQCDSTGTFGCYDQVCVEYSQIPLVDQCLDFVQGGDETDVDCGGATCLPCVEGKKCVVDSDCFGVCNTTTLLCQGVDGATAADLFDLIRQWILDHPGAFGTIVVAILAIFIVYFARSSYKSRKERKAKEARAQVRSIALNEHRRSLQLQAHSSIQNQNNGFARQFDYSGAATAAASGTSAVATLPRNSTASNSRPRTASMASAARARAGSNVTSLRMAPISSDVVYAVPVDDFDFENPDTAARDRTNTNATKGLNVPLTPSKSPVPAKPKYYENDIEDNI